MHIQQRIPTKSVSPMESMCTPEVTFTVVTNKQMETNPTN